MPPYHGTRIKFLETNVNSRYFAVAALLAAPALIAATPSGDLASVQQHLRSVESMTADFTQTDRNGGQLTGTLTLKRPGKVRFQYQKGVQQLIVGDGKALWFIDYQVRQVSRWPVGNSPLAVLLNPNADISRVATLMPAPDPRFVMVEAHDSQHPEYGRLSLVFARSETAPAGLMLQGWVALDSQNNRTTIRLTHQQFNLPISDRAFRWDDPRAISRPGR